MLFFKIISTQYVVKHLNTCSTACVITTVLNTLYESVLMFSTPMLCQIGIPNPPPTIENMNIKGKCVSKGCMKWTCPIYHTSDFHDGCPRKCFNHFLKDTSFYVCFYIRSPMGSTLPLPHVGSAADSHSPSYAPILKPSAVLIPPLDMPQNLPHHFLLM